MPLCKLTCLGFLIKSCRATGLSAEVCTACLSTCLVRKKATLSVIACSINSINLFNSYQPF